MSHSSDSSNARQIWIISDGKPGHLNQSRGLAEALARQRSVSIHEQPALGRCQALGLLLRPGRSAEAQPSRPALLIGTGHGTHLSLLALKHHWGVPTVVLMKPSLPLGLFDLCLIPEHDQPPPRRNVIRTRGPLNRMQPGEKRSGSGVILVGGPSKHFSWEEAALLAQIEALLAADARDWVIGSSRRTPESTAQALKALAGERFVPAEQTDPEWLPQQLAHAEVCWVSQDSASMVYEALTAGCRVGVLTLDAKADNRIALGVDQLQRQGVLGVAPDWHLAAVAEAGSGFNEADRCAEAVLQRGWLDA